MFRCLHLPRKHLTFCWHEIKIQVKHFDVTTRKLHISSVHCCCVQNSLSKLNYRATVLQRIFSLEVLLLSIRNHTKSISKVGHQMWPQNVFKWVFSDAVAQKLIRLRFKKSWTKFCFKINKKKSTTNLWNWFGGLVQKIDGISRRTKKIIFKRNRANIW